MSVVQTTTRTGPFTLNGATTSFPLTFHAMTADEIRVYTVLSGVETTVSTGYSITGLPGVGTVNFDSAPAAALGTLYAESDPTFSQDAVTSNLLGLNLDAIQLGFDKLTVRDQFIYARTVDNAASIDAQNALIAAAEEAAADAAAVAAEALALANEALGGVEGPAGPPGGDASQLGPATLMINSLTIGTGINRVWTTGHAANGDGGAALWEDVTGHAVTLPTDRTTNGGTRKWRISKHQIVSPEMFGAVGDAEVICEEYTDWTGLRRAADVVQNTPTDNRQAWAHMFDWLNFQQSFHLKGRPGSNYFFDWINHTSITYDTETVTLWDGRTCSGSFINTTEDTPRGVGWNGFVFDMRGCKMILDGDFSVAPADFSSIYRLKDTMIPFYLWKCRNGLFEGLHIDGQWRYNKTTAGTSGECFSYAVNAIGAYNLVFRDCVFFDMAQDAVVLAHRNLNSSGGITLGSVEGYPEPDMSTDVLYAPEGRSHKCYFENIQEGPCRRQGMSPIGIGGRDIAKRYEGLVVVGGQTLDIGVNIGELPKFKTGDIDDGSVSYQYRGYPPRACFDFEPQRQGPYQVDGVKFIGHRFDGAIGSFIAAQGDWGLNRVEQSVIAADVDATANSFTKTGLTLPAVFAGQIPSKVRCWSDGTLPGGLATKTDYYLFKTSSTVFKLARTYEDALAGNAIDLASQGTGTHWFVLYNSHPNVGTIDVIDCSGVHPWNGSLAPWQVYVERLLVQGGVFELKCPQAYHGPSSVYRQGTIFRGVELRGARQIVEFNEISAPKTLTYTPASSTIVSATSHGFGKYDFTTIRVKGGTTLPPELKPGKTYYADRISDTEFRIAASLMDAANGTWIVPSTAGTGTQTAWYFPGSQYEMSDCTIIHTPRDLSFDGALDVDTVNNRIHIPMSVRGEGVYTAELLKLRQEVNGVGTAPTGLTLGTTYYPFFDENEPDYVYLASSSANATAETAIDLTGAGSGRLLLAQTNSSPPINIYDTDVTFQRNQVFFDRLALSTYGGDEKVVSITGSARIGGNTYDCNITSAAEGKLYTVHTNNLIALAPDRYPNYETMYPSLAAATLDPRTGLDWRATVSYNPPSLATTVRSTVTVTITNTRSARDTITRVCGLESTGLEITNAWISADNTLSMTLYNPTGSTIDAGSTTLTIHGNRSQV